MISQPADPRGDLCLPIRWKPPQPKLPLIDWFNQLSKYLEVVNSLCARRPEKKRRVTGERFGARVVFRTGDIQMDRPEGIREPFRPRALQRTLGVRQRKAEADFSEKRIKIMCYRCYPVQSKPDST